jgi:site-specific recombinase XerD
VKTTEKGEENDMNAIAQRITAIPATTPAEMAMRIKREAPALADLNQEQLEQIARMVIAQRLAADLNKKVDMAGVDWQAEKETFLSNAGKSNSVHTRTGYRAALGRLETWTASRGISPLELTPALADDWIYSLKAEGRAPASIRLDTAAASSFYTFLHRRHTAIENPFRGTKARPAKKDVKKKAIPDAREVKAIIAALSPMEAAAASVMAYRGLRAGALPTLSIAGGKFTGYSKGKDIDGELPQAALKALEAAGLPLRAPFAVPDGYKPENWTNTLEKRIVKATKELYQARKIRAAYSCHALRHFYAVTEYQKSNDIHRIKELLGHASIQVTETYLKSLKVEL